MEGLEVGVVVCAEYGVLGGVSVEGDRKLTIVFDPTMSMRLGDADFISA